MKEIEAMFSELKTYKIPYTADQTGTAYISIDFNITIMTDHEGNFYRCGFYIGGVDEPFRMIHFSHLSDLMQYLKPLWKD